MKHVAKKITVILLLSLSLLLTSCSNNPITIKQEIKDTAEQVMEALANKDAEKLFSFFAQDMKDNRESETMEEIQQAFEFIDGKIISYDYRQGGGQEAQNYGEIYYYDCRLEFTNVTTDTGNTYSINCTYHYIWDSIPEREGITKITIFKDNDRDNQVQIGRNYSVRE